jgi:hypothetical protein
MADEEVEHDDLLSGLSSLEVEEAGLSSAIVLVAASVSAADAVDSEVEHDDLLSGLSSLEEKKHGGHRHGKRRNEKRRLIPEGVIPKPSDRTAIHNKIVAQAMWTGRSQQASAEHTRKRKHHLTMLEKERQGKALRVAQLARTCRKPGLNGRSLTTLAKLEIAFPVGPLRTAAAAAAHMKCSPNVITYNRKGMSELLLRDHCARTKASSQYFQRHLLLALLGHYL